MNTKVVIKNLYACSLVPVCKRDARKPENCDDDEDDYYDCF